MLDPVVVSADGYGDPVLHSALALAYVRDARGAEAMQHFALVAQKDPDALQEEDVAALIQLLALPKKDADRVIPILKDIGPRAITMLKERSEDKSVPGPERKRAREALIALGQKPRPADGQGKPEPRLRRAAK
jgi:hypothetical protein